MCDVILKPDNNKTTRCPNPTDLPNAIYPCTPLYTHAHLCILMHTSVYSCTPLYTHAHLCILLHTCAPTLEHSPVSEVLYGTARLFHGAHCVPFHWVLCGLGLVHSVMETPPSVTGAVPWAPCARTTVCACLVTVSV